ncbi:hypothetical protein BASA50_009832 [Batrachochytrium salamandrivorans]|uniref:Phosphatase PP2A regulatory subunit A/Splicing factor 3B subunit 1-like HEAT repeat domain-containing protein n=1 Tax=Batrachochytrium salamandrivorans TaxID=1357716 RepID=A0ABQ8F303_9FUNG|nr:hypothetical protein BASA50_009832 [Batrachochytrium salamandrivorans]
MEAEESLREAAALGNIAAIRVYLINGINVNSQNRMNGWTALHWACSRGHKEAAQVLIRNGAKDDILSTVGKSPIDVAKGNAADLFTPDDLHPASSPQLNDIDADCEEGLSIPKFVPNYLRYPDLSKAWEVPSSMPVPAYDASVDKPAPTIVASTPAFDKPLHHLSESCSSTSEVCVALPSVHTLSFNSEANNNVRDTPVSSQPQLYNEQREVLVFIEVGMSRRIMGAMFISQGLTIKGLCDRIRSELDCVPSQFMLARCDGDDLIPFNLGQHSQDAIMHIWGGLPPQPGRVPASLVIVGKDNHIHRPSVLNHLWNVAHNKCHGRLQPVQMQTTICVYKPHLPSATLKMNPDETDDALYPIAVLIDELKNDDVVLRLNAIRRLSTIALALGAERTRDELIPFLDESVDDEDEILLALAEELGGFVDYVGGPSFAHILFTPLENLAAVEETVVREKAIESAAKIVIVLSQQQIEEFYLPMLKRLSTGDWFTSRTSACGLYAPAYPLMMPAYQDELRTLYAQLCNDDTPMVRRSAATYLAKFTKSLSKAHVISSLLPVFNSLAQDEQDSVRLLMVDSLVSIAEALTPEECKQYLLAVLRSLCADKSWRVRYMIADKFVSLSKTVGADIVKEDLTTAFVHILKDNEAEVRTAASTQVPGFSALISQELILSEILPCVKDLVSDSSQHVRAALATQISNLAPILGKDHTIEHLLPLFLQLLKDEASEVRLNIISKLDRVNEAIGIDLLSQSLLPAIVELAEDKQWRVRLAIIENIPLLASQLGVAFFDEKLSNLCMSWLGDCVFSIREAATNNLRRLIEVFGVEWAKQTILPKILAMAQHSNYLYRMTTVFAITTIAQAASTEVITDYIVPTATTLSADPIPNIRFNVAKAFGALIPIAKKSESHALLTDQIKPALVKLSEDPDMDVRYFAQRALLTA